MLIEENVPASQPPPPADARISEADEHGDGPQGAESATGKGPPPPRRLVSPAREGRLRTHKDFQDLYEHGSVARGEFMVLIARANGLERVRLGVVASRKVGGAVVRNRCKRLLREAARTLYKTVEMTGVDLLLIARPPCRNVRLDVVQAESRVLCAAALARVLRARPNVSDGTSEP